MALYLVRDAVETYRSRLQSSAPLINLGGFYDEARLKDALRVESSKVKEEFMETVGHFYPEITYVMMEELATEFDDVEKLFLDKNEQSRKFSERLKEILCDEFRTSSEMHLAIDPYMELASLQTFLQNARSQVICKFENQSNPNPGNVEFSEELKTELDQALNQIEMNLLETHQQLLDGLLENDRKLMTELHPTLLEKFEDFKNCVCSFNYDDIPKSVLIEVIKATEVMVTNKGVFCSNKYVNAHKEFLQFLKGKKMELYTAKENTLQTISALSWTEDYYGKLQAWLNDSIGAPEELELPIEVVENISDDTEYDSNGTNSEIIGGTVEVKIELDETTPLQPKSPTRDIIDTEEEDDTASPLSKIVISRVESAALTTAEMEPSGLVFENSDVDESCVNPDEMDMRTQGVSKARVTQNSKESGVPNVEQFKSLRIILERVDKRKRDSQDEKKAGSSKRIKVGQSKSAPGAMTTKEGDIVQKSTKKIPKDTNIGIIISPEAHPKCQFCKHMSFQSEEVLAEHMKRKHVKCQTCGRLLKTKYNLLQHQTTHFQALQKRRKGNPEKRNCHFCKHRTFQSGAKLDEHIKKSHFECQTCGRLIKNMTLLKKHQAIHARDSNGIAEESSLSLHNLFSTE